MTKGKLEEQRSKYIKNNNGKRNIKLQKVSKHLSETVRILINLAGWKQLSSRSFSLDYITAY